MKRLVLLLVLAATLVPAAPTAGAYACAFDVEHGDVVAWANCERGRMERCHRDFVENGSLYCPA